MPRTCVDFITIDNVLVDRLMRLIKNCLIAVVVPSHISIGRHAVRPVNIKSISGIRFPCVTRVGGPSTNEQVSGVETITTGTTHVDVQDGLKTLSIIGASYVTIGRVAHEK